ncbi:MAG: L-arabinonate dehydratase [Marinovum algicola]|uniref:L-arabinonate dehydratase n=1 Tax=Marinovum algicola TaxID=42444 RepID=UPI0032EB38F4
MTKTPEDLRSHRWFGDPGLRTFGHRSRMRQMGYDPEDWEGRPIIAIINTWSDINPCHAHFRQRAESVKTGILQAGGFPLELPAISLAEQFVKPSAMLYRNLLAMETEELIRSHPIDGVVLMGGCDKTTPALLMGAASMNLPAIFVPAGPMLRGNWRGKSLGSGSDTWKYWAELKVGNITRKDWEEIEDGIARTPGTCMTMGTAATMMSAVEALGMSLPASSAIPAADSNHSRMASQSGRRIVEMVWDDQKPSDVMTEKAFENAIMTVMAIGGSTNAAIHLLAMAGRLGVPIDLDRFDSLSRRTPWLADIRPSGRFLMEDFYYAGGLPALMGELRDLLHLDAVTVSGRTLGEDIERADVYNEEVIRRRANPLNKEGGLVVLRGNLAPDGAVIKQTACDPKLLKHKGPAVVFADYNDMAARIDDPDLPVTPDSVIVLKHAGPQGGPGMPEWGMLPIPKKILELGVRDMVRISDARMSGTSYGTCVLHVAPESWVGGPLALVKDGDMIELDVAGRRLHLDVSDAELDARRAAWVPPARKFERGFGAIYADHITQADKGCDFDVLMGTRPTPEPEIH